MDLFFEHQPNLLGRLTAQGATLRVRLCDALFSPRRLDQPEGCFRHISARPPFGQCLELR
jgi:hypothetical protein